MKEQIEIYVRYYVMGDITLAECSELIYRLFIKTYANESFYLLIALILAIIVIISVSLA